MALNLASTFAGLLALVPLAYAQAGAYAQCGGIGWTGPTDCVDGYTCEGYFLQCLPGTATASPTPTVTVTATITDVATTTATATVTDTVTTTVTTTVTSTSGSGTTTSSAPGSTATVGLAVAAKTAGKLYFGSATDNPELTDAPYVAELSNWQDFLQLTPDATEPTRGNFTFTGGQQIVSLAQQNGQLIRGHNCVWYNQLPSWVTSTNWDNATLLEVVANHCAVIVANWAGQICGFTHTSLLNFSEADTFIFFSCRQLGCDQRSVYCILSARRQKAQRVSEPFNDDGTWRQDVFYNVTGEAFVATALRAAHAADPNAKLYINDYNLEYGGAKAQAMINLVTSLQAQGVPIHGVGIQGHLLVGGVPGNLQSIIESFTALGVEVAITELDIRMTLPVTDALLEQQKADYQSVITACNKVPGCIGVTVWDYTDKYSWVPSTFSGQGAACPFDANLVKKPAYDGIVSGFMS
ncbi:hypothetical protein CVT26_004019 [Gymnopilus dilepis]|uniref:Beta-xylanase n=1 Tax=Gymnopilus dilepis TaxID=231916 RepID=A0A409W207_9AGAR|nr:hypothetical protein CVT26_004019 [Gymnopilus dilepis]